MSISSIKDILRVQDLQSYGNYQQFYSTTVFGMYEYNNVSNFEISDVSCELLG